MKTYNIAVVPGDGTRQGQPQPRPLLRALRREEGLEHLGPETLRDAQENPANYRDLVVRVAGYCALFNDLSPQVQNEIIRRTTHETL